jgi:hypothetical protein
MNEAYIYDMERVTPVKIDATRVAVQELPETHCATDRSSRYAARCANIPGNVTQAALAKEFLEILVTEQAPAVHDLVLESWIRMRNPKKSIRKKKIPKALQLGEPSEEVEPGKAHGHGNHRAPYHNDPYHRDCPFAD